MFVVNPYYQTNPLSKKFGGFLVGIKKSTGLVHHYPNVKNPKMYFEQAFNEGAEECWVVCKMNQIENIKISNWSDVAAYFPPKKIVRKK